MATDEAIVAELRAALKTADMETTTERQLRKQVEAELGVDLTDRKAVIRAEIEAFLAASLPPADETKAADEEEEEEEEADQQPVKRQKRNGAGFGSMLSPAMQEFLGCDSMPRPQVVKQIWAYIKEHELQNPADKRKIILDDKLATLFTPPINIFSMNKQLSKHVFAAGASAGAGESAAVSKPALKREAKEERDGVQAAKPTARKPASKSEGKGKAAVKSEQTNQQEEDDDGSEEAAPKKRKANGFTKQIAVSDELAQFLGGKTSISRPELTSAFWDYIKSNNLQDPKDRRHVLSDATLKQLTGQDRFQAFGFAKLFNKHLYPDG